MADTENPAASTADAPAADGFPGGFGFKKRTKVGNARKRPADSEGDGAADNDETVVVRKERKAAAGPLAAAQRGASLQTTVGRKEGHFQAEVTYASTMSAAAAGSADQNATATLDVDTERDRDAEALHQKQLRITRELEAKGVVDDQVYRGQAGYTKFVKKQDDEHGAKFRVGPQRGSNNVRTTIRFDYQPDICKDYKETGYCGYGDSCKFLHDRGDYKSGWQLEKEWEERQKNKVDPNKYVIEDEDQEEELPFACLICRQDFVHPIVTRCGHYFCEKCALEHYKKTPKCFTCGEKTSGIFNTAKDLLKKLEERKQRMQASGEGDGEGVGDSEAEGHGGSA